MIPLPQVTELDELPPEFATPEWWPQAVARRSLPTGAHLSVAQLMQFKALMLHEGWPVQLARMCYDRLYAYERIAQAHASANDVLRRVALQLFQAYHRLDEAESRDGSGVRRTPS